MFDIFLRACRNPVDYGKIVNCNHLTFLSKRNLGQGTFEFNFQCKKGYKWQAGQHAIFTIPDQKITGKSWRVFSVASAPHENIIKIATIISDTPSDFKQKLMNLAVGEKVHMHGPIGEFYLTKRMKKVIGIAGGIGITPFRSILAEVADGKHPNTNIELIYAGKDNFWAFEEEIRNWSQLQNVIIHFVNTPDEVNSTLDNLVNTYKNNANYFISGSPGMIGAIKGSLQEKGIKKIINDPFKGY